MPTVVVSPFNVVNFPQGGGHYWVCLQYALGLHQLNQTTRDSYTRSQSGLVLSPGDESPGYKAAPPEGGFKPASAGAVP